MANVRVESSEDEMTGGNVAVRQDDDICEEDHLQSTHVVTQQVLDSKHI